jgi:hypothetical protein
MHVNPLLSRVTALHGPCSPFVQSGDEMLRRMHGKVEMEV